jgi:hypothetical protein
MLDKPHLPQRARLAAPPEAVLATLPQVGRLMITAKNLGATHERIGPVETVRFVDGWAIIGGTDHESRIELSAIAEMIVDRTSIMQGKTYPRLDLNRPDGSYICGIVGFDGIEPFDSAIAAFGPGEALDPKSETGPTERTDPEPTDPGLLVLEASREAATPVIIDFRQPGFWQAFRGVVETVKPAMGFINVMRPDFHLHLKSGAVAVWRPMPTETGTRYEALGPDGVALGLSLFISGPPLALTRAEA